MKAREDKAREDKAREGKGEGSTFSVRPHFCIASTSVLRWWTYRLKVRVSM